LRAFGFVACQAVYRKKSYGHILAG
jgi:hypothetical protein